MQIKRNMKYEKKNNKYIFQMTKRKELYGVQFRWFEWKEHICCERAFRKCWLGTIERRTWMEMTALRVCTNFTCTLLVFLIISRHFESESHFPNRFFVCNVAKLMFARGQNGTELVRSVWRGRLFLCFFSSSLWNGASLLIFIYLEIEVYFRLPRIFKCKWVIWYWFNEKGFIFFFLYKLLSAIHFDIRVVHFVVTSFRGNAECRSCDSPSL